MSSTELPVIVGACEVANKDDGSILHPGSLLETVARGALSDGADGLAAHVGAVYSCPLSIFSDISGAEVVGERLGLSPGLRVVDPGYSGTGPLTMLDDACRRIASGEIDAALVVAAVADASVRRAQKRGVEPPAPPGMTLSLGSAGGDVPDLPADVVAARADTAEAAAGIELPSDFFALAESRMAHVAGHGAERRREYLGQLLARFSEVASTRPDLAWFTERRRASDISTVSPGNRLVAEPYTKLMCSFPTVDLGAAVIVTSSSVADRAGIPPEARVHPWGVGAACDSRALVQRPEIHWAPALSVAVHRLLETLSVDTDAIGAFDFYSCFPAAPQLAAAAFGIDPLDARGLTVTGGMPYFGGPGASYGLHGIAAMVEWCREHPAEKGAVVGLGGMMEKFTVGVLSTAPAAGGTYTSQLWGDVAPLREKVPVQGEGSGEAEVFAGTVLHRSNDGPVAAPVIAELPGGTRLGARAASPDVVRVMSGRGLAGRRIRLFARGSQTVYEPL